jgi:hypothetical protein
LGSRSLFFPKINDPSTVADGITTKVSHMGISRLFYLLRAFENLIYHGKPAGQARNLPGGPGVRHPFRPRRNQGKTSVECAGLFVFRDDGEQNRI